eukprot:20732-Heterococcus_DN1.PRE.1
MLRTRAVPIATLSYRYSASMLYAYSCNLYGHTCECICAFVKAGQLYVADSTCVLPMHVSAFVLSLAVSTGHACTSRVTAKAHKIAIARFFWPSRHTLAAACLSTAGFQSGSKSTSLFPPIRFSPQPPACVHPTAAACNKQ